MWSIVKQKTNDVLFEFCLKSFTLATKNNLEN